LKIKFNDLAIINQDTLIANIKKYKKLSTVVIGVPNSNYAKYSKLLKDSKDTLKTIQNLIKANSKSGAQSIVSDSLSAWEIKKAVEWNGYQVKWFDFDINVPFTGYLVYDGNRKPDSVWNKLMSSW